MNGVRHASCGFVDRFQPAQRRSTKSHEAPLREFVDSRFEDPH